MYIKESSTPNDVLRELAQDKLSLDHLFFELQVEAIEDGATVVAANHLCDCQCACCFIFFASTGDSEETGPFSIEQVNQYRALTGRAQLEDIDV